MQQYWVWFSLLKDIKDREKRQILEQYPDPEELFRLGQLPDGRRISTDLLEAEQVVNTCKRKDIQIIPMTDPQYPERLRQIPDPPFVLYCKGILPDLSKGPVVGVVGTRRATDYGLTVTERISREIVRGGGTVISGGAAGIDTAALRSSLQEGVPTVAVLGCGVDVTYPTTNRKLFMDIVQNGCLLSEYIPGSRPTKWTFPARNRIISGLSQGTLVIEAPLGSGALITARNAAKQGRTVFVVPANVDMESCAGSNQLLKEGAQPVITGEDILCFYSGKKTVRKKKVAEENRGKTEPVAEKKKAAPKKVIDNPAPKPYIELAEEPEDLTEAERKLLSCITQRPESVDTVLSRGGIPVSEALAVLTTLRLRGLIMEHPGRLISRKMH